MWEKPWVLLLVAAVLLSGLWPALASAAVEKPPVSLEQAIKTARAAFPELDLDEADFFSNFMDSEQTPSWQLHWSSKDGRETRITVNANNGRILEFNLWEDHSESGLAALPKLSEAEALAKAESFLKRLVPTEFAQTRYQAGEPLRPYLRERNRHLTYNFNFQRFANDIPFNYNGLRVEVNADTGAVTAYTYTWTEGTVPQPSEVIGADKAATIAQAAGKMELQYYLPYTQRGETAKPILVYQAPRINYLAVDAFSGEVISQHLGVYRGNAEEANDMAALGAKLSPAEQQEVTLLAGMLTQTQAEAKARQIFSIAQTLKVRDARLTADWRYPEQRQWTLTFEDGNEEHRKTYISVTLDAKSGEIYRYYTTLPREFPEDKATISWEEAEKLAQAYLQRMNPSKARQVELVKPESTNDEHQTSYYFSYRRLVNGVPFPQNGFEVAVWAGAEPEITSYTLNWVETEFPAKAGSLSLEQAHTRLSQNYPFKLEYRVPSTNYRPLPIATAARTAAENPITLVYTQGNVPSSMFSAKDAQPLDYQGKPVQSQEKTTPTDIAGDPAEAAIRYLAQVGILTLPNNGRYQPAKAATVGDWLELLAQASGSSLDRQLENLSRGESLDLKRTLQRQELALYAVRALGYDKVAAMSNIFRINAADADEVKEAYTGHVAIALELALLQLEEQNIAPTASASRGELATALMQMLGIPR